MRHIIDIENISNDLIIKLIERAQYYLDHPHQIPSYPTHSCGLLFFENSTRTLHSFYLAATRLSITPLMTNINTTSLNKQESVTDMLLAWAAMGVNVAIIRHGDNHFCQKLKEKVDSKIALINAGSGMLSHPSQALLDAMTIHQAKGSWNNLKVVIMGDYNHSRVARSLVTILNKLGRVSCHWVGPEQWQPRDDSRITVEKNIHTTLSDADVIVCLRIQQERLSQPIDTKNYLLSWGLTKERLKLAKPDAIVMHPGPINRDIEIASDVANCQQSCIHQQVTNGLYMRMAILATITDSS